MIRKVLLWLQPYIVALYARFGLNFAVAGASDSFGTLSDVATNNPAAGGGAYSPKIPESSPQGSQVDLVVTTNVPGAHASHERPILRGKINPIPGAHVFALVFLTAFATVAYGQGGASGGQGSYDGSNNLQVNCRVGCSSSPGFTDNSGFTVGTSTGSVLFGYYTSGADPALSTGNAARFRIDAHSYVLVDCAVGCSGGTFNNNSDAVATSATNGQSAAWLYGFNGTTFDRLRVDGSKNLEVNINASSATVPVSGTFWQTTQPVSGTFWQTTQPVSGTFWQTTQPASCTAANCSINLADLDGTALGAPSNYGTSPGAVAVPGVNAYVTNTVPVTGTFYQATQPISAASLPLPSNAAQETGGNLATLAGGVSSSKYQGNVAQIGGTAVVANPCQEATPTTVAISQTASTKVITGVSSKKNYICSIMIVAGAAEIPSIVEGTGSTCGSNTAAVVGSTTTANGVSLAANGGFAIGNGAAAVIPGINTDYDTCLFQNGSNRLSGYLTYVQE